VRIRGLIALLGLGLGALAGGAGAVSPLPTGIPVSAPQRLSETGLYAPDGSIDPRNLPYAPQYPLWTDGAAKARWIRLPEGTAIDVSDADAWSFPIGTILWKEFAFGGRKVETRMIWRTEAGTWEFATYVWNQEQSDAILAPADGLPDLVEIAPGRRHSIPGVADCLACHGSSPSPVLGFSAIQLSDDRDPLAPHAEPLRPGMVTLRALVDFQRLDPPRREWADDPPRIRAGDPVARAALGYLSANCGHCHNDRGPLARLGLALRHDDSGAPDAPERAVATAVGARGRYLVPGAGRDGSWLVAPGDPAHSALLYRMESRHPSSQMPPLGTVLVDADAARLVRAWIATLSSGGHGTILSPSR
jgi:hypothetical protein